MKRPSIVSILTLAIVVFIGVSIFKRYSSSPATWQPIKQGPIVEAIYGLGTVTSDKIYHLKVGVPSHVKKLYVHEGDEVQAGQALVELNSMPIFKANFAGTITSLSLHANETVSPQSEVLTLMDLTDCYVRVSLEQEAAVKIHKGQSVKLSFSGLPNQSFDGVVTSVYPKDQESFAKITVNNLPKSILPDMSSDVAIILDKKENAILIPMQAVQNSIVTIKRQGKTQKVTVQLGSINDDYAEVLSDNIKINDEVLVKV